MITNFNCNGFIKISNDLYVNHWDMVSLIMRDFRPTHIEFRHWENSTWYLYGYSSLFDDLVDGNQLPQYDVIFQRVHDELKYKFERV